MKVLIIGDGLLGSELKKLNPTWGVLSRKQNDLDINQSEVWSKTLIDYDVVVNCIAHTNTYDINKDKHWEVNYKFVDELIKYCNIYDVKLVQISTDYVYANSVSNASEDSVPVHHNSWYAYTKLLADGLTQLKSKNYLLIRCGFKPTPFPYPVAPSVVLGNFDYVDTIAEMISTMIQKSYVGLYNVGTELKTMHQLALDTNHSVLKSDQLPIKDMPTNVSMDLTKLNNSHL